MLLSWGWCRNITLPQVVYLVGAIKPTAFTETGITCLIPIYVYYLSCLVVLHYYWMYLFLCILHALVFKGETEDKQNKTEFVESDSPTNVTKSENTSDSEVQTEKPWTVWKIL